MTEHAGDTSTTRAITASQQVQACFCITHRRAEMYYIRENRHLGTERNPI